ncbi:hypothetical protein [Streptomyces sp. NPDC048560]|uniref:hypothetical protein n=1 Tax=Streptomyces sp. NPDC048560 TaxID=3155488 RepID=UPI00341D0A7B
MVTSDAGLEETTGPPALLRGFLTGGMTGAALACMVSGVVIGSVPVLLTGAGIQVLTVVVLLVLESRMKAGKPVPVTRTAPALIETVRAVGGESANIPVEFDLTVAPDDRAAYRVTTTQLINLADLPVYRPRGMTVVEFRPDEPWWVEIVTRPSPEWLRRQAAERVDSAPESTRVRRPATKGGSCCLIGFVGLLIGAAVAVVLLRGELFGEEAVARRPASAPDRTFSSSTTVSGPSSSLLRAGRMRAAAESLTGRVGTPTVDELTIEDHRMAVKGEEGGSSEAANSIDLRTLPYELLPGLVREARTSLEWAPRGPGASTSAPPRVTGS